MGRRRHRRLDGKKGVAALLAALYAAVVFSASPEWVAWRGPLLIGSLDVQTTDSGFAPRGDDPGARDGLFGLLAFLSAGAILLLTSKPPGRRGIPSPMEDIGHARLPSPKTALRAPAADRTPLPREEGVDSPEGAGIE